MKKSLLAISALALLASCVQSTSGVYSGIYTKWSDRDPISRVDNSIVPTKKGVACMTNILGIKSTGDNSIDTAKKNGNISKVAYVDRTYKAVVFYIPFFQEGCTVVVGK